MNREYKPKKLLRFRLFPFSKALLVTILTFIYLFFILLFGVLLMTTMIFVADLFSTTSFFAVVVPSVFFITCISVPLIYIYVGKKSNNTYNAVKTIHNVILISFIAIFISFSSSTYFTSNSGKQSYSCTQSEQSFTCIPLKVDNPANPDTTQLMFELSAKISIPVITLIYGITDLILDKKTDKFFFD